MHQSQVGQKGLNISYLTLVKSLQFPEPISFHILTIFESHFTFAIFLELQLFIFQ